MICISSKLPILQVASYQLSDYDTKWLFRSIQGGFSKVGIEDVSIAQEVYLGVLYYLENDCPWTPLKIENLYTKVENLFKRIGFPHMAGQLPRYSPSINISVSEQLEQLDCQIEIALFNSLQKELEVLSSYGAEKVILENIIEAVYTLIPCKKWSKECQLLHDEIFSLQEKFNDLHRRRNYFMPSSENKF